MRVGSGVRKQRAKLWQKITFFVALLLISLMAALLRVNPLTARSLPPRYSVRKGFGFGHAGSVAFSRTTDFEIGKFNDKHVLRRFGQVTDEYR
jgi:hypothetical protein